MASARSNRFARARAFSMSRLAITSARHPGFGQVIRDQFGILARPHDHHPGGGQIDLRPGQFHRGQSDGDRPAIDMGPRPHGLAHPEGVVEEPVENQPAHAGFERFGVGGLDLGEDLVFADHLRIQPGGHLEQMPHHVHPEHLPAVRRPRLGRTDPIGAEQSPQKLPAVKIFLRIQVELQPVAGLENDRFADPVVTVHLPEHGAPLLGRESHLLTDLHGAIVIRQVMQNQLHV